VQTQEINMNVYMALAGYLALVVFYSYELSEHLRVLNFRRMLISLLAVIGCGFLVCHFVLEAGHAAVERPPTYPPRPEASVHMVVDEGFGATPASCGVAGD
jgi:hypothetical protein